MDNSVVLEEHEKKHLNIISEISSECTLFLKRSNNDFPLIVIIVLNVIIYL